MKTRSAPLVPAAVLLALPLVVCAHGGSATEARGACAPVALAAQSPAARHQDPDEPDPDEAFAPLRAEYDEAFREFFRARREASEQGVAFDRPHPAIGLYPRALEHARRGSGRAVLWCLQFAQFSGLEGQAAIDQRHELYRTAVERHADAPYLGTVMSMLRREYREDGIGRTAAAALFRALAGELGDPELRAKALFDEAYVLAHKNEDELDLALAMTVYREVLERHPESEVAALAAGKIFSHERLRVGLEVPDFVAVDTAGTEFRLSEYRGKVVVLSFWGFWCGPCVRMLPHERELAGRLADQPFALIGINTDEDPELFARRAAEAGVTWRNAWQGSTKGALVKAWGVTSFPAIYVLDARGTIRFIGPRGEELDQAVDLLLAESRTDAAAAEPTAARATPAELDEAYRKLEQRFRNRAHEERAERGALTGGSSVAVSEVFGEFEELAGRGSCAARNWIVGHVDDAGFPPEEMVTRKTEAFRLLFRDCADQPFVPPALTRLKGSRAQLGLATCEELLELLVEETTLPEHGARARFVRATMLEQSSGDPDTRERARRLYREVARDFSDSTLAGRARDRAASLDRVRIGAPAPALAGEDAEGRPVRLDDLRGQVVVVSFWSLQGAAGKQILELDKLLVENLSGRPFVYLGVNVDRNRRQVLRRIERLGLPWRNLLDGSPGGPLCLSWAVTRYPVRFVVDAEGVLRHIELGAGPLRAVVDPLLDGVGDQRRR